MIKLALFAGDGIGTEVAGEIIPRGNKVSFGNF